MNPRVAANRPERPRASAALLAVVALLSFGAPATAGCGSSDHRPALPLEGDQVDPSTPRRPGPACTGPSCSRNKAPLPIAPTVKLAPRPDLLSSPWIVPDVGRRPGRAIGRRQDLLPIGRVTDVDRPPSALA